MIGHKQRAGLQLADGGQVFLDAEERLEECACAFFGEGHWCALRGFQTCSDRLAAAVLRARIDLGCRRVSHLRITSQGRCIADLSTEIRHNPVAGGSR
ncbi:hypothetical protein GCM10028813_01830 [Ramlibacter alkalitolerans]